MPYKLDGATYTEYSVSRTRIRYSGLAQMPVAGDPPQASQFVAMHAPYEQEVVMCSASRDGYPPDMPDPFDLVQNDPNYILLHYKIGGMLPMPTPGVGYIYLAWGHAVYGLQYPVPLSQGIRLGVTPFDPDTASNQYIPGDSFIGGIVDSTPSTPDGSPPTGMYDIYQNPLQ